MKSFLRSLWSRAILRGIHYRDLHSRFDQLYRIQDPWRMDNESERFRFEETNRLIQANIGPTNTLLEIGCGEGHQTAKLGELCKNVYAIDISARAIDRAKQRYRQATFDVGDVFTAPVLKSIQPFDLVLACEVLYYVRNVPDFLARMEQLGRSCFVTYVSVQGPSLSPILAAIPHRQTAEFEYNQTRWYAVWWQVQKHIQES
jgi:2-polyprenyl-3-methyl-5-hydroxy-6-metoxy-1,4-benzoquinol methylase